MCSMHTVTTTCLCFSNLRLNLVLCIQYMCQNIILISLEVHYESLVSECFSKFALIKPPTTIRTLIQFQAGVFTHE